MDLSDSLISFDKHDYLNLIDNLTQGKKLTSEENIRYINYSDLIFDALEYKNFDKYLEIIEFFIDLNEKSEVTEILNFCKEILYYQNKNLVLFTSFEKELLIYEHLIPSQRSSDFGTVLQKLGNLCREILTISDNLSSQEKEIFYKTVKKYYFKIIQFKS